MKKIILSLLVVCVVQLSIMQLNWAFQLEILLVILPSILERFKEVVKAADLGE